MSMLLLEPTTIIAAVILAMMIDRLLGEPDWLYRQMHHPVAFIGRSITWFESQLLDVNAQPSRQRYLGIAVLFVLVIAGIIAGWSLEWLLSKLPLALIWIAVPIAMFLAHRSLIDHVKDVALGLEQNVQAARKSVARIVGRDPEVLDEHGIARAAVESLAENLSDAVIAPLFWTLVGGLPGLIVYKTVNTLDSMIGYQNDRYRHFGWASARFDDLLNLIPARITALLLIGASVAVREANPGEGLRIMRRDARQHRSPNAGYPEAAMAGTLNFKLSGPRAYHGGMTKQPWVGDGSKELASKDVLRAVGLANTTWLLVLLLLSISYLLVAI